MKNETQKNQMAMLAGNPAKFLLSSLMIFGFSMAQAQNQVLMPKISQKAGAPQPTNQRGKAPSFQGVKTFEEGKTLQQKDRPSLRQRETFQTIDGTNSGGGGGFVEKGGKVLSMQEAGYLMLQKIIQEIPTPKTYDELVQIDAQTKEEVKNILSQLPLKKESQFGTTRASLLYNQILTPSVRDTFIKHPDLNPELRSKLLAQYRMVVSSYGLKLDESILFFPAFSRDNKTYIIGNQFTDKLNSYQRALNLIHEYNIRTFNGKGDPVKYALEIDSIIYQYLNSPRAEMDQVEYSLRMQKVRQGAFGEKEAYDIHFMNFMYNPQVVDNYRIQRFSNLFQQAEEKNQKPLLASQLFLNPYMFNQGSYNAFDPRLVQQFNSAVPLMAEKLDGIKAHVGFKLKNYAALGGAIKEWMIAEYDKELESDIKLDEFYSNINSQELAKHLIGTFDLQCQQHRHLLKESGVEFDKLVHFDSVSRRVYAIDCYEISAYPGQVKGFGSRMEPGYGTPYNY